MTAPAQALLLLSLRLTQG